MQTKLLKPIGLGLLTFLLTVWVLACGDSQGPVEPRGGSRQPDTFTFLEVGKHSVLSKTLRQQLADKLGDAAVEHRSILDLEISYKGFLKAYFPKLEDLNRQLNSPLGERVEHATVKLMYRYPQKMGTEFKYVHFVFSEHTLTPLVIRIDLKTGAEQIIETLQQKYGPPQSLQSPETNAQTLYWEKMGDYLILATVPDQFGTPRYQIVIYFSKALEELRQTELADDARKKTEPPPSEKSAF